MSSLLQGKSLCDHLLDYGIGERSIGIGRASCQGDENGLVARPWRFKIGYGAGALGEENAQ